MMADVFDPEKRSWVMSRIGSRDTKPELLVRSLLHSEGFRFTVNGPLNRRLPGRPDLVLPKWETVVFVHGCFWHAHRGCKDFKIPKTRTEWWREKLEGNRKRDAVTNRKLGKDGWNVMVVWECQLKNLTKVTSTLQRLASAIRG